MIPLVGATLRVPYRPAYDQAVNRIFPVALLTAVALAGCSGTVEGRAVKPSASALGIRSITQVLPDISELAKVLGSPMKVGYPDGQPGGADILAGGFKGAEPAECVPVKLSGAQATYQGAHVKSAVVIEWETSTELKAFPRPFFSVQVAVVELGAHGDARDVYARAAALWQRCQGKTIVTHDVAGTGETFADNITQVSDAEGMLTAVDVQSAVSTSTSPNRYQRAFTAVSEYLVDVRVVNTAWRTGDSMNPDNAVAVAQLIASRISSPS
ncbi:Hypothetical conserved lipoprotein LppR [Mycobacteroides abscessus subsp. abscessus]|nr:putative lipoprotein [Mycobacteroides abscessus 3A-0119-R]EIV29650.1 putative lipoprotein [Mycobacteroides abscessus 3A-0122-R]EIV36436.1 putative lipoprotein [Mycobacteroides abscessus 3A-0122-S]EIV38464.1 putative lipoprotein [Mycobacteroides abscessus 3A-0731]EIV54404.1 putative lipoprotein [Mycobacteroides abscessus 3A-0930-R]EIV77945.1 pknH-like extracellular domain protein [Mycobacteroides abscessus 3A-0810-R]EPZ22147.1 hypothetical protein M879_04090 [Mycobacteroides abscessus V0670